MPQTKKCCIAACSSEGSDICNQEYSSNVKDEINIANFCEEVKSESTPILWFAISFKFSSLYNKVNIDCLEKQRNYFLLYIY